MYLLYTLFFILALPFIGLRLYYKGRLAPAYRLRIAERFFMQKNKPNVVDVWLHAVSLGEVVAASVLIEALLAKQYRVLVTTMTPTGSQQVLARFKDRVEHQYIPYDLPWILRRFLQKTNPRCCVVMETELWPNLLRVVHARGIALFLVNARISNNAWQYYRMCSRFFKPLLTKFTMILAQSELDKTRFLSLGAPPAKVSVLGNIKFDVNINATTATDAQQLRVLCGAGRIILLAASTHDNEEQQWLEQLTKLQTAIPGFLLLIAPRHPERFKTVYALSQNLSFNTGLRSNLATITQDVEVVIIDSIGELLSFYQISDYAFVGGSLVPVGGHNVLEPIALGVPVFCGNFMHNSQSICDVLIAAKAIVMLPSAAALSAAMLQLAQNPTQRRQQIERASHILSINRGVVDKTMQYIDAAYI